ncbi:MAG TPA: hypothetical protein VHK91_12455 [Flavisolibacter sp.]|nr:hypothetical protein [Flavisolibacter sp.]
MRLTKRGMFLLLNGSIALGLLLYFLPWAFSRTTTGQLITPYDPNTVHISYQVDGKAYEGNYMRNGVDLSDRRVHLRYLPFRPSISRINSFLGIFAEPLAWWGVFLVASAMLLLTPNGVFTKGTIFQLQRRFPFISMEEYFPAEGDAERHWYRSHRSASPPPPKHLN